MEISQDDELVD